MILQAMVLVLHAVVSPVGGQLGLNARSLVMSTAERHASVAKKRQIAYTSQSRGQSRLRRLFQARALRGLLSMIDFLIGRLKPGLWRG